MNKPMDDQLLDFQEIPTSANMVMLTGWRQWADAGTISSELPAYLIKKTGARKIGELKPEGFYLFQMPGTHHLLRPVVQIEDGQVLDLEQKRNEFYFSGDEQQGMIIFLGDEPHLNVERYGEALFNAVKALGVKQMAGLAGVFGPTPYDKDRQVSCIYSLPEMRQGLEEYAVTFSNYEGGSSIDSYLVEMARRKNIPYFAFYAFVPAYDFSQSAIQPRGIQIERDYMAWLNVMQRLNHMLDLNIDLRELEKNSAEMVETIDAKIEELIEELPEFNIREYLDKLSADFDELSFVPLDDVWEQGLRDLFNDMDE
ncbi:MAG: PAC2 family protein [Anaerolineales bacterium]|nr:PAC2 family protein [Anaerolineales bacterium]